VDRLRVLVVESREVVAARLKTQLEGLGHEVVAVARDGREAIARARESQPNLIFINNRLPTLSGVDAARAIVNGRLVPVVLITDYAGAGLVRRAQEAGVLTQFQPGDRRQLQATIARALARFRELELLRGQASDLGEALASRKVVAHAKEILVARARLSEAAAFDDLRERSASRRTTLRWAAATVVEADQVVSRGSSMAASLRRLLDIVGRELAPRSGASARGAAGSPAGQPRAAAVAKTDPAPTPAPA
jgi:AmiR/NasT family two-component response regulator